MIMSTDTIYCRLKHTRMWKISEYANQARKKTENKNISILKYINRKENIPYLWDFTFPKKCVNLCQNITTN